MDALSSRPRRLHLLRVVVRGRSSGVGPAGRADPGGAAVRIPLGSPWSVVFSSVMPPTEQMNVVWVGGSTQRPRPLMVEIAARRGHRTAREGTNLVARPHEVGEARRWPVYPSPILEQAPVGRVGQQAPQDTAAGKPPGRPRQARPGGPPARARC